MKFKVMQITSGEKENDECIGTVETSAEEILDALMHPNGLALASRPHVDAASRQAAVKKADACYGRDYSYVEPE